MHWQQKAPSFDHLGGGHQETGHAEAERRATRRESGCDRSIRRIFIWAASSGGRRRCRSRRRLTRGDETAEQARRIKQRPRSTSAEVNRSLRHKLGRVRQRGRDDLGVRVGELRDRVQRKFKLAQLSRRFRAACLVTSARLVAAG